MSGTTLQTGMTSGQKRLIRRLLDDGLDELGLSKEQAQRLLGKGGDLKAGTKELIAKLTAPDLLEHVASITLPAIAFFSAKDHFQVGKVDGVKMGWIGEGFTRAFLGGTGKVETSVAAATLRIHKLLKGSVDDPIIAELGGEEVAETTLVHMWEMMKAQSHGQRGDLLTDCYANIFYIKDARGVLWAVDCRWNSGTGCWLVSAHSVTSKYKWCADLQVVSG